MKWCKRCKNEVFKIKNIRLKDNKSKTEATCQICQYKILIPFDATAPFEEKKKEALSPKQMEMFP